MPQSEFAAWQEFYSEEPFDDHFRYQRPALLVAQSMAGGDVSKKAEFLSPEKKDSKYSDADARTLEAFGIKV